jgi:hypothetical protein
MANGSFDFGTSNKYITGKSPSFPTGNNLVTTLFQFSSQVISCIFFFLRIVTPLSLPIFSLIPILKLSLTKCPPHLSITTFTAS